MPLRILSSPTVMRRRRVSSSLAEVTQQIHSLRARGVMSAHTCLATGSAAMAMRRSAGILCTGPLRAFLIPDIAIGGAAYAAAGLNFSATPFMQ
jgi:hypothetical protein